MSPRAFERNGIPESSIGIPRHEDGWWKDLPSCFPIVAGMVGIFQQTSTVKPRLGLCSLVRQGCLVKCFHASAAKEGQRSAEGRSAMETPFLSSA